MGCAARSRSLCSNFSPEAAREFDRLARPITLARGETLVWDKTAHVFPDLVDPRTSVTA